MNNSRATIISSIITGVCSLVVGFGTGRAATVVNIDSKILDSEYVQKLETENSNLKSENEKYISQIKELEKEIEEGTKKSSETGSTEHNEVTAEPSDQKKFLSNIEELGTQGDDDFYCTFGTMEYYSSDNIGNYHNNGLIFIAKNKNQSILSKTYYNNGKYNTINGTIALTQETKDTQSVAVFRIYGIKADQSIETLYTSKKITNSVVPEQFSDIDISPYEIIKVEVTFNDGDLAAIGLYDAYFE